MAPRFQEACHLLTRPRTRRARQLRVLGLRLAAAFSEACGALPGAGAPALHKVFAFFRTFVRVWPAELCGPTFRCSRPGLGFCTSAPACVRALQAGAARRTLGLYRALFLGPARARGQPRPLLEVGLRRFSRGGCAQCFKPLGCCTPGPVRSSFALQTLLRCQVACGRPIASEPACCRPTHVTCDCPSRAWLCRAPGATAATRASGQ